MRVSPVGQSASRFLSEESAGREGMSSIAGRPPVKAPSTGIEKYLNERYGPVLGNSLMRMLSGGDLIKDWRGHQDLKPDRLCSREKEEFARLSAIKGVLVPIHL